MADMLVGITCSLNNNQVGDDGARTLAEALRVNTTLRKL